MAIVHALEIEEPRPWGRGLHRPECVVGTAAGDVYVSDWRGGVTLIRHDGSQEVCLDARGDSPLRPNGIWPTITGSFLIANLGEDGGIWRITRTGAVEPVLLEVDGIALPPANFVVTDNQGRTWISVSTRLLPRQRAWRRDIADGFIVMVDSRGARIVADGLHYTNEVRLSPAGDALYAIETFGRRLVRFPLAADGSLRGPEAILTLPDDGFPDGFEFDEDGGIWITSLVSNRLYRLHAGRLQVLLEEVNAPHVAAVAARFERGEMQIADLGPIPGTTLQHLTSISFSGPDGRTAFVGGLHTTNIFTFRSPVRGCVNLSW